MSEQLLGILAEIRRMRAEDNAQPLISCPVCGNVLDVNERGEKNCDVGHFTTKVEATGGF